MLISLRHLQLPRTDKHPSSTLFVHTINHLKSYS
jgi:hypothetical protein